MDFEKIEKVLEKKFGFNALRPGQKIVLQDILAGKNVVAIMPTGAGKSLLYQLPSLINKGTTLVISPLISLMKDQVDALNRRNIPATFINSALSAIEKRICMQEMADGQYQLVYVAPERFHSDEFQRALDNTDISLLAVDEAHCISQWGHDFRPDYLRIKDIRARLKFPQTIALTATATADVRREIAERLEFKDWVDHVAGFDRNNLYFCVQPVSGKKQKLSQIMDICRKHGTGIIYASTRKHVKEINEKLRMSGINAACYHAGMEDFHRELTQDAFMSGEVSVVVATNAFGMGVDKADIRFVVHYDIPSTIESYYQEIGRAGRDGKESHCYLLFNYADTRIPRFFIEEAHPAPELVQNVLRVFQGDYSFHSLNELASMVNATSAISVRYAMGMLEKAGLINDHGALPGDRKAEKRLQEIIALDKKRLENDEQKLQKMIGYAYHTGCRRLWILDYFGDHQPHDRCQACDNCRQMELSQEITGELLIEILKTLSAVARLEGRAGKSKLAQVLAGSKAEPIIRLGFDQIPTHGALSYMKNTEIARLLEVLIGAGLIQVRLKDGQYPLLYLTSAGRDVMMKREPCYLPKDLYPVGSAQLSLDKAKINTRKNKKKLSATLEDTRETTEECDEIYQKLAELRRQIAGKAGKPPFVVFHNRTLREMAQIKPQNKEEMSQIAGIGKVKLKKYGDKFLKILQESTKDGNG